MIVIESGAVVNRGVDEAPITHWPAGELWDIAQGLLDAAEPMGQVVLPQPRRIPVEERARRIKEEIRLKLQKRAPSGRPTQQAAYEIQMSRMYPTAADMQAAREQQIRAVQMLSDLGQYPRRRVTRVGPGRPYQISRQRVGYRQAQAQRAAQARRQAAARQRASGTARRPPRGSARARTPVFQPRPRRAARPRPRTGLTAGRRRAVARRSPIPSATRHMAALLRRYG